MDWSTLFGLLTTVLTAVGGASFLAAWLPRPAADSRLNVVFMALDWAAQNYLNARNAAPKVALLLALPLMAACGSLSPYLPILAPGVVCALSTAGAIEAQAASDDPDAIKAVGAAVAAGSVLAHDAACQAAVLALAASR